MKKTNFFGGGGDESPKRGRNWIVWRFKRGLAKKGKKEVIMFLRWGAGESETPMHIMSWRSLLVDTNIQNKEHCNTVSLLIILTIIDT